jgi:hypothetical protein
MNVFFANQSELESVDLTLLCSNANNGASTSLMFTILKNSPKLKSLRFATTNPIDFTECPEFFVACKNLESLRFCPRPAGRDDLRSVLGVNNIKLPPSLEYTRMRDLCLDIGGIENTEFYLQFLNRCRALKHLKLMRSNDTILQAILKNHVCRNFTKMIDFYLP